VAYAAQIDLENQYGTDLVTRLADHDGDGVADQAAIDDALASATSIIDAYLAARYTVPLENPPPIVRDLTVDIAWYRLAYSRLKQTAEMRLRYEDAIKFLTRVADGKASIGLDTTGEGASDDTLAKWEARTSFLNRA
jgi:phage gp36-like protein